MSLDRRLETGNPFRAYAIAGAKASARDLVPKRASASSHAATAPGRLTERGPDPGTDSCPARVKKEGEASAPARPLPFIPTTSPVAPS